MIEGDDRRGNTKLFVPFLVWFDDSRRMEERTKQEGSIYFIYIYMYTVKCARIFDRGLNFVSCQRQPPRVGPA